MREGPRRGSRRSQAHRAESLPAPEDQVARSDAGEGSRRRALTCDEPRHQEAPPKSVPMRPPTAPPNPTVGSTSSLLEEGRATAANKPPVAAPATATATAEIAMQQPVVVGTRGWWDPRSMGSSTGRGGTQIRPIRHSGPALLPLRVTESVTILLLREAKNGPKGWSSPERHRAQVAIPQRQQKPQKNAKFHWGLALPQSGRPGSNRRPSAWEADALPTELLPHGPTNLARAVEWSTRNRAARPGPNRPSFSSGLAQVS